MPLYKQSVRDDEACTLAIWKIVEEVEELVAPLPNGEELLAEQEEQE